MNEEIKEILDIERYRNKDGYIENISLTPDEIHILLDYITNLQQENQDIKDTLQDKLDYIGHLKELCDKYEEEHNTEFNEWVFDKRENERLRKELELCKKNGEI